ncbi:peptidase [Microbacterium phage DesireeRose]|nr:peptidase [Microbacterium phage Badulia]UJQ86508.1 peptidase [Microbacterium phage DesireeRose]WGH20697.1 peptidase [Microbacterium phage SCoupsA]WGH21160.1 hypothetical protein SEA_BEE17_18 [Microbacterium phage Bee17]
MEPLAIAVISCGVWVTYCGALGIPPIETLVQVIQDPASARQNIATAREASKTQFSALAVTAGATSVPGGSVSLPQGGGNPFTKFSITRDFADHIAKGSNGIDYGMPVGTPLPSAIGGTVTISPNSGNYGHKATVRDGVNVSTYAHLSSFAVKSGQVVKPGDVLGASGGARGAEGAGNSTGPHLHWEMTKAGVPVSPLVWFAGTTAPNQVA